MRHKHMFDLCRDIIACIFIPLVVLQAQTRRPSPDTDSQFVQTASAGGMGELRLARLAETLGRSDLVKRFASRIATDQTKADTELKIIAAKAGIPVAESVGAKDRAFYDTLSSLSGPSFDGVFISAMVTDHREDIAAFQKEADIGNSPIQDYARRMLPILKEHLRLAEEAASRLGVSPTATGGR